MRVGALLNHYQPHQVPHVAPYLFELSRLRPDWDVRILCASAEEEAFAREIGQIYPGALVTIERIYPPFHARAADPIARKFFFYKKPSTLRANRRRLAAFDALIVPEITTQRHRVALGLWDVKMIFTGHGAGDLYSNQFGMFDPLIAKFDLVMLQGRRIATELTKMQHMKATTYGISGYPKYEIGRRKGEKLFDNDLPTILYNPTQNPRGSSWQRFGVQVLDHFAARDDVNLIFAPHALLFERPWKRNARLPRRFQNTERILIDKGSRASCDLTYVDHADLYLGDQSSQVYEFIRHPRPCVFLNASETNWQGNPNFRSWTFGPVVDAPETLGSAIEEAFSNFGRWRPEQEAALALDALGPDAPFHDAPASLRGAEMIAEFLETGALSEAWR